MKYIKNEQLRTILPDWQGNPFDKGEFRYIWKPFQLNRKNMLKMMLTKNPQLAEKKADKWRPTIHQDSSFLESKEDFIVWLGHAVFLIQLNGVRMITDPVLVDLPFLRRQVKPPFPIEAIRDIDYILLSHDHRDHCDKKSIKALLRHNQPKKILTPLKLTNTIQSWVDKTPIEEAGWYQQYDTADSEIEIFFLPSQHWCRRYLWDFNRNLWGSFIIRANGKTLYFGGDSGAGEHFAQIGQLFPDIDVAMIGIGAYAPDYMMQGIHANPKEGFEAAQQLGAKMMIPMHYATYDLSNEPISEPYRMIQQHFEAAGIPERVKRLGVCEPYYFS